MHRIIYAVFLTTLAVLAYTMSHATAESGRGHQCDAPCVVHFQNPMAEDDFAIDYRNKTVRVWKLANH